VKIALLGTRGIPASYGGFETFAEELGWRLVSRGHSVTIYCREKHGEPRYRGVDLVYLPTIRHKYFDTLAHTLFSTLHLCFRNHGHDAVLYCNAANAIFTWMPRLFGMPVAINVDGLERKRKKWNALARTWYLLSEWLSTKLPTQIVTDAVKIREYYLERYGADSTFIAYGAETGRLASSAVLDQLALERDGYFLYVSRMEPENNGLLVRESFERVPCRQKLALIGDAPYAHGYIAQVRDTRDTRVVMPGAIYGAGYKELQSHCFAYIHATEVGGTHPALIEAMGRGALVLYLETVENSEVAGGVGIPFTPATLSTVIEQASRMPQAERERWGALARARVEERYGWDAVTSEYEALFRRLLR
jgi:glycosyltransferase involved in cell wall biosynthesis